MHKTTNILQLIKEKKLKEDKRHAAQLCMAGHCPVKK